MTEHIQARRLNEARLALSRNEAIRDAAIAKLVRSNDRIKTARRSIARYEKAVMELKEADRAKRKAKLANNGAVK